jgi:hypothetical protein
VTSSDDEEDDYQPERDTGPQLQSQIPDESLLLGTEDWLIPPAAGRRPSPPPPQELQPGSARDNGFSVLEKETGG